MAEPGAVCSLKQLAASTAVTTAACGRASDGVGVGLRLWGRRASYRCLQMALLYLAVVLATWVTPPLYHRISETGQAVVFTLVDSASIELQNRASPVLPSAPDAANLSAGANASAGATGSGNEAGTAPAPKASHRERGTGPALPTAQPAPVAGSSQPQSAPTVANVVDAPPQAGGAAAAPAPEVGAAAAATEEQSVNNATEEPAPGVPEDEGDAAAPASPEPSDANDTAQPEDDEHYVVRAEPKQVESNDEAAAAAMVSAGGEAGADGDASWTQVEAPISSTTHAPAHVVNVSAEPEGPSVTEDAAGSSEDIPSFNEWAQRQLAEAEEKKKVLNGSGAGGAAGGARQAAAGSSSGSIGGGGAATGERPVEGGKALKLRSKNYASPDCGAKIVAANPEAVSPGAVLSSSRDEYMLNTCTNRAWFVVELCEAIQAKKVELANFELFSSSPREFTVSVSDRVQGREWRSVGRFAASEERVVQSFALTPQLFGRYVKVEVLSHHGSEHFCPLSLFRVYGTSEFEVLEKVDQATDEDGSAAGSDRLGMDGDDDDDDEDGSGAPDDEDVPLTAGEPPKNLFESYKNAVFSIVKQAAQALTKGGDGSNKTVLVESELDADASNGSASEMPVPADASSDPATESRPPSSLCKSPRHLVVCDNCSDALYADVFALLSCRERDLEALMASAFVADSLRESGVCARFGLSFARRRPGAPFPLPAAAAAARTDPGDYFVAFFPPEYVAALCNLLAIADRRVALNVSDALNATATRALVRGGGSVPITTPVPRSTSPLEEGLESAMPPVTCTMGGGGATRGPEPCPGGEDPFPPVEDLASRIKPTKTLAKEESGEDTAVPVAPRLDGSEAPSVLATEARHETPTATATVAVAVDDAGAPVPALPANVLPAASVVANATATPTVAPAVPPLVPPALVDEGFGDPVPTLPEAQEAEGAEGDSTSSGEEPSQENLDTLLRDLKDWDQSSEVVVGTAGMSPPPTVATPPAVPASVASPASVTTPSAPPHTTSQKSQPQAQSQSVQKESVFVRLANRIKALERNMSLSGQYLEELSRRYKKQVEEMQKAFNRTLQAVHEAGRIGEDREAKWHEEMQQVQQQVLQLTGLVEDLVGERDSWLNRFSVLAQHAVLICIEVFIFVFLMYFCRRLPTLNQPSTQEVPRKVSGGIKNRKGNRFVVKRRKSVEGVSGHESPRTRHRRPSEEALHISGSYQDLLISEPAVIDLDGHGLEFGFTSTKVDSRRRRRKKKDALLRSASVRLPVRGSAPLVDVAEECVKNTSRRASSLELGVWWASNNGVEEVAESVEADPKEADEVQLKSLSACSELKSLPPTIENISPHNPLVLASNSQNSSVQKQENGSNSSSSSSSESKVRSLSDTVSPLSQNNGLVRSNVSYKVKQQLSSPMFMRTATSVRNARLGSSSVEPSPPAKLKSDNWEWYSTHHGLDKSSQPNKVKCTVSCPGNTPGESGQRQNGHTDASEGRRSSNASNTSSTSNISEGLFRKDASKKGPSSLKKMVKKFF